MSQPESSVGTVEHSAENINVFSFSVSDTLYSIRMENVLSLSQGNQKVRPIPGYPDVVLGVVDYQTVVVPIFDLAMLLETKGMYIQWEAISKSLLQQKQEHLEWMASLEQCLRSGETFTKGIKAHECPFWLWYDSFKTDDEELRELLVRLEQLHQNLHEVAEQCLSCSENDQDSRAVLKLDAERKSSHETLLALFDRVHKYLGSLCRTVLLYTTVDGGTPLFALKISEVSDSISYTQDQFSKEMVDDNAEIAHLVEGFLSNEEGQVCILLDVLKLKSAVSDLAS